jgi:hypothetical protein
MYLTRAHCRSGEQIISSMAPTGSAAMSCKMFVGDELISVDGCRVKHFAAPDIIALVKGPHGSQVRACSSVYAYVRILEDVRKCTCTCEP